MINKKFNKSKQIIIIGLFIFMLFPALNVKADAIRLNSDEVSVRSDAGTGYINLGRVSTNSTFDYIGSVPTRDSPTKCSSGTWYKISYNSNIGYVCSSFATLVSSATSGTANNTSDAYDRPWITPKKSIVNGAKYIAEYYISKGQYTIYLKKFNVNPNATKPVFSHQYQTNLTAPYTEAQKSYNTYMNNNLLSKPIVFSIPIYNNMPDVTIKPGQTSGDTSGQTNITDQSFEDLLNNAKDQNGNNIIVPESYRKKIRLMHSQYPNWSFEFINTGIDWNTAVNAEQPISYVYSYKDSDLDLLIPYSSSYGCTNTAASFDGEYCRKEGSTYYLANWDATAYFMDPRNFLNAERILMFEKLSYSSNYDEKVIQSMLNSTFMAGNSAKDGNQSFASIFVEAGKTANTSALYLVSLSLQEVGSNGSTSTSGAAFTYNNLTYAGLYNFYNIGANTGALDGLYWANNGATSTLVTNSTSGTNTNNNSGTSSSGLSIDSINNRLGIIVRNSYATGISGQQSLAEFKSKTTDATVSATDSNGKNLPDSSFLKTGDKIIIDINGTKYDKTVVVYGDINGDSSINPADLLYIRKYLLKSINLTGANLQSADIDKNGTVNPTDLLYIRKYLMDSNTYKISQQ